MRRIVADVVVEPLKAVEVAGPHGAVCDRLSGITEASVETAAAIGCTCATGRARLLLRAARHR